MRYQLPKPPAPRPELLLHPNIPKPLHGLAPRTIKGQEWWDKTRKEVYKSTAFHCAACGVHQSRAELHKWLEAHEVYDIDYAKGRVTLEEIVPLCHYCHSYIHSGYLEVRQAKGEVSKELCYAILKHGNKLTKGLKQPKIPLTTAAWEDWRLVFEGKSYEPLYKSYEDWYMHYNGRLPNKIKFGALNDDDFDSGYMLFGDND